MEDVVKMVVRPKRKHLPKFLITAGIILILGVIAAVLFFKFNPFNQKAAVTQRTAVVTKGSLSVTVSGSGAVEAVSREDITPAVSGKITGVYFKEGDRVKKGDLLFELDDSSARLNIEKINNSIAQARLTAQNDSKNVQSLVIKAPFGGRVTNIAAKAGDELGKGTVAMTITNTSQMKVTVPFSSTVAGSISMGQKVTVNIQDIMQAVTGKVTYKSGNSYVSDNGAQVFDVEIVIDNPGSLKEGMLAGAEIDTAAGTVNGAGTGKLGYADVQVLKSSSGGTVQTVNVRENQLVTAGSVLMVFKNDDLEISSQTSALKIQDLEAQLKSAQEQLASYKLASPINGIIVSQNAAVGDSAGMNNALATISDVDNMKFSINIDELDIDKIKTGQKVSITIDALADTAKTPLTGLVSKVAAEGASTNGVTSYPVEITFDSAKSLKAGMNANAEIIISSKADVLTVPLEAVQKVGDSSFVMVKGSRSGNMSGFSGGATPDSSFGNNASSANGSSSDGQNSNSTNRRGRIRQNSGTDSADGTGNRAGVGTGGSSGSSGTSGASGSKGNFARRSAAASSYYANAIMKRVEIGLNNDDYVEITNGLNEGDVVILPQLTASTGTTSASQQGIGGALGGIGGMEMGGSPPSGGGFQGGASRSSGGSSNTRSNNSSGGKN